MGPYLQVMGTVLYVRYPGDKMPFNWHTDGGDALRHVRVEPASCPLNFKRTISSQRLLCRFADTLLGTHAG